MCDNHTSSNSDDLPMEAIQKLSSVAPFKLVGNSYPSMLTNLIKPLYNTPVCGGVSRELEYILTEPPRPTVLQREQGLIGFFMCNSTFPNLLEPLYYRWSKKL